MAPGKEGFSYWLSDLIGGGDAGRFARLFRWPRIQPVKPGIARLAAVRDQPQDPEQRLFEGALVRPIHVEVGAAMRACRRAAVHDTHIGVCPQRKRNRVSLVVPVLISRGSTAKRRGRHWMAFASLTGTRYWIRGIGVSDGI
jgi:hypothetical protein